MPSPSFLLGGGDGIHPGFRRRSEIYEELLPHQFLLFRPKRFLIMFLPVLTLSLVFQSLNLIWIDACLSARISRMKFEFPNQSQVIWEHLQEALGRRGRGYFLNELYQPILLLGESDSSETLDCLSYKLYQALVPRQKSLGMRVHLVRLEGHFEEAEFLRSLARNEADLWFLFNPFALSPNGLEAVLEYAGPSQLIILDKLPLELNLLERSPGRSFATWYGHQWRFKVRDYRWLQDLLQRNPLVLPITKEAPDELPCWFGKDFLEFRKWRDWSTIGRRFLPLVNP